MRYTWYIYVEYFQNIGLYTNDFFFNVQNIINKCPNIINKCPIL